MKPSEKDPTSTMFIAELLYEAGLPEGVLNIVNGNDKTVQLLLEDKRIGAVSFVGSTRLRDPFIHQRLIKEEVSGPRRS